MHPSSAYAAWLMNLAKASYANRSCQQDRYFFPLSCSSIHGGVSLAFGQGKLLFFHLFLRRGQLDCRNLIVPDGSHWVLPSSFCERFELLFLGASVSRPGLGWLRPCHSFADGRDKRQDVWRSWVPGPQRSGSHLDAEEPTPEMSIGR